MCKLDFGMLHEILELEQNIVFDFQQTFVKTFGCVILMQLDSNLCTCIYILLQLSLAVNEWKKRTFTSPYIQFDKKTYWFFIDFSARTDQHKYTQYCYIVISLNPCHAE